MEINFEQAEKNLADLIEWYKSNVTEHSRNEATTRLQLIDRLLFECFGWKREDCISEQSEDGQYADYSLYCPQRMVILEAKKEGVYFELPLGSGKLLYEINFFLRNNEKVAKAIRQAVGYCQSRGTPFGVVSNGWQLLAFIASRNDGLSPLDGKALVFDSLETLQNKFLYAWQCLSKPGVIARRLVIELQNAARAPVPDKLSARINNYPGFKQRNPLQTDLQILSELFIEDIARLGRGGEEQEFLAECYCQSGALSQYASVSKEILRARYSALFQTEAESPSLMPATTKKGLNPEFLAQSLSRRPILLIGDRGVGKSMFITHLYQVEAREVFADALVLYIDFGSKPTLIDIDEVRRFVGEEIGRQLLDRYNIDIYADKIVRGVLHRELERFGRGIYGAIQESEPDKFRAREIEFIQEKISDRDQYLQLCLDHISKGHRKQVVIFLDNVDQRSDEFQEKVFLIGQGMSANWPVTVFISIRPETFYNSRVSGTLSAYHPRAFTISPPRVDEVIGKRLEYGISLLAQGNLGLGLGGRVAVKLGSLQDYIRVLLDSFRTNKALIEFLDNMCGGNIRLALDFVRDFIGSGHVDTEKIIGIYKKTGSYWVPLHEFLRAVTYGDHEHYSPIASEILNVFDVSTPDGREHFLASILLSQMGRWAQQSTTTGFVETASIYSYLQGLGFDPDQINNCLTRLLRRNLIELPTKTRETGDDKFTFYRITSVGAYYVKSLVGTFSYVDAMIVDTPIVDPKYRSLIRDDSSLAHRLERTKLFCDYLDSQWGTLSQQHLAFDWLVVRQQLKQEIVSITDKAF